VIICLCLTENGRRRRKKRGEREEIAGRKTNEVY